MVRALALLLLLCACVPSQTRNREGEAADSYAWVRLTEKAAFPPRYNFPVHVRPDGSFAALHPEGIWQSMDGRNWRRTGLAPVGMNSPYLSYVDHDGASWALGAIKGDYRGFVIDPIVRRTRDHRSWEQIGRLPTLPRLIFAASASFKGSLWLLGGYDGSAESNGIWRSEDGLHWQQVATAPWSPRAGAKAIIFRDRLFLIGGGIVDGKQANDVWSSSDGMNWRQETESIAPERPFGFTPAAFDGKLWLIGANRAGRFSSEMLVSNDGKVWRPAQAPWSPRGGVAAWTRGDVLYITGGKYSVERDGEPVFIYSNDVWAMRRKKS